MIGIQVVASGSLDDDMARFGQTAPKLVDRVIRVVAYRYRKEIRKNYLSGQYLAERTGLLQKSLVAGRKRGTKFVYLVGSKGIKNKTTGFVDVTSVKLANIYEHAGGYIIEPKQAKALRFALSNGTIIFSKSVKGKAHPFMSASSEDFDWETAFQRTEIDVIGREIKKLAKQGIYIPEEDL